jgi:F-type H+-transporting ATPase subunit alpha
MFNGEDVLIVFDDLSKHAVAYRTLSLLLRKPPGREAYPGDVFYLHSKLLERAANLNEDYGGGSITALPIVETQAGDISAYIPTNVISITDGQIFLLADAFNSGQRPAVDPGLSVSRVGSAAQTKLIKKESSTLKLELANYGEVKSFAEFSSDLDVDTKRILDRGEKITLFLRQPEFSPYNQGQELVLLYAIKAGFIDRISIDKTLLFRDALLEELIISKSFYDLITTISNSNDITEQQELDVSKFLDKITTSII